MYKIIASDPREGAILQKENGEFCFSSLWLPVREEWLQGFREGEIKVFVERGGLIRHKPPTLVEKFEDWPKEAVKYEASHKRTYDENVVHTVAP